MVEGENWPYRLFNEPPGIQIQYDMPPSDHMNTQMLKRLLP